MATTIDREQLERLIAAGAQVVEVLPEQQYADGHIPGAINIPLKRLDADTASVLERGRPVVVYCWDPL